MDRFYNGFTVGYGVTHAQLLEANLLALAAKRGADVEVEKLDTTTVAVTSKGCRAVGSDFENLATVIRA